MGKDFDALCDSVFKALKPEAQQHWLNYAKKGHENTSQQELQRMAADEFMAHIAEQMDFNGEEKTIWDTIVNFIKTWLKDKGFTPTEEHVRSLLRASYSGMVKGNITEQAGEQKNTANDKMFKIIGEKGAAALDKAQESTIRLDNLDVARQMEEQLKPDWKVKSDDNALKIKIATGWERGADGKWRHELPDIKALEHPKVDEFGKAQLKDLIQDDELFAAYPSFKTMEVRISDMGSHTGGSYDAENNLMEISIPDAVIENPEYTERKRYYTEEREKLWNKRHTESIRDKMYELSAQAREELRDMQHTIVSVSNISKETLSVIAHEIQHAIQYKEGFADGGSLSTSFDITWKAKAWAWRNHLTEMAKEHPELAGTTELQRIAETEYKEYAKEMGEKIPHQGVFDEGFNLYVRGYDNEGYEAAFDEYSKGLSRFDSPEKVYKVLGGEVESRNVQKRMDMTPEQRRSTLLSATEDVAREDQIFIMEGQQASMMDLWQRDNDTRFKIDDGNSIEFINNQFNEQLQQQIDGTLPSNHTYQLGKPSSILLSAGIPDFTIELRASQLVDKSRQYNHPFELSEVKDLVKAIQKPLVVFRSATHVGSHVVLTELGHGNRSFVAAMRVLNKGHKQRVEDIRSLHYRRAINIINWINENLANYIKPTFKEEWFDKMRRELLSKPQYNPMEVRKQLSSAANIIENFENPKLPSENNDNLFKIDTEAPDPTNAMQSASQQVRAAIEEAVPDLSAFRSAKSVSDEVRNLTATRNGEARLKSIAKKLAKQKGDADAIYAELTRLVDEAQIMTANAEVWNHLSHPMMSLNYLFGKMARHSAFIILISGENGLATFGIGPTPYQRRIKPKYFGRALLYLQCRVRRRRTRSSTIKKQAS